MHDDTLNYCTGGGVDYGSEFTTLTFDSTDLMQPQCVPISINDDDLVEIEETFSVSLSESNIDGQIVLQISFANISIADNDGELLLQSAKLTVKVTMHRGISLRMLRLS